MIFFSFILLLFQEKIPFKPQKEFEIITNYELRKKPDAESSKIVFEQPEERRRSSGTDMLPYLSLKLKVKKWAPGVSQIKIADSQGKVYIKKKITNDSEYSFEMGFVDDIKDKVATGKFFALFIKDKKLVEQITIEVEEDGTFRVNGELRGKF